MARRIFEGSPDSEEESYQTAAPLGRFARPDEIAAVIAHLLSPDASYTTGTVYAIDAGSTAGYFRPS